MNAQKFVEINIMKKYQMELANHVIKGVKNVIANYKINAYPA